MQHATEELIKSLSKSLAEVNSWWKVKSPMTGNMPAMKLKGGYLPTTDHPDFDDFYKIAFNRLLLEIAVQRKLVKLPFKGKINEIFGPGTAGEQVYYHASMLFNSCMQDAVMMQKVLECGIHELTISADQALGMADMQFNIEPKDFMLPSDSVFVHIPQETFALDRFKPMLSKARELLEKSNRNVKSGFVIDEINGSLDANLERFFAVGAPLTVLVQRHPSTNCLSVQFLIGEHSYCFVCAGEKIETALISSKEEWVPELFQCIHKIAMSAVLISTVKPNICKPRELTQSVVKHRARFLESLAKVGMRIEHAAYFILQPDMKTYREKSEPVEDVVKRTSPDRVIIKPIFVHGHFRQQPYGEKRLLRRLQWIKACIRNKYLLKGEKPVVITQAELTQSNDVINDMVSVSRSVR